MVTYRHDPWEYIAGHYRGNPAQRPMLDLVEYLRVNYHHRLYGFVFLDILIISCLEDISMYSCSMHIEFDSDRGKYRFQCYHSPEPLSDPDWELSLNREEMKKIDRILLKAKWF
jgi:hypothetical protein